MIEVLRTGAMTTVQGGPVRGRAHHGFSLGGAADARSLAFANRAVGNAPGALGLEAILSGPKLTSTVDVDLCICGAPFLVSIDDTGVPLWTRVTLCAGQVLSVTTSTRGLRCAIAFAGGIAGAAGTVLARGQKLALGDDRGAPAVIPVGVIPSFDLETDLHVTDGPQRPLFAPDAVDVFESATFTVGTDSDRRGVRMHGPRVTAPSIDLVTEGASFGAIQIPASGQPIILGVDQCTTGGYAKIANVISVDLWRVGQLRPGERVRFTRVTHEIARALFLTAVDSLSSLADADGGAR